MEIERKYLIKEIPLHLTSYPCHHIEQAYLNIDPVVRIRRQDDNYYLTYKGEGMISREEYNLKLNKRSYYHLLEKHDGNVITKTRFLIPLENPHFKPGFVPSPDLKLTIELDLFEGALDSLVLAEIEFPDLDTANALLMPDWFSKDVSNESKYHNSNLSKKGI